MRPIEENISFIAGISDTGIDLTSQDQQIDDHTYKVSTDYDHFLISDRFYYTEVNLTYEQRFRSFDFSVNSELTLALNVMNHWQ